MLQFAKLADNTTCEVRVVRFKKEKKKKKKEKERKKERRRKSWKTKL